MLEIRRKYSMNMLEEDILNICKNFIEIMDKLYKSGQITHENYIEMAKLKLEYINNIE